MLFPDISFRRGGHSDEQIREKQQLLVVQQRMQTRREVEAAEAKQRQETIVAETQMKSADCFSKIGPIIFSNLFMSQ